jgi:WD40 repeat protein
MHSVISSHEDAIKASAAHVYVSVQFYPIAPAFAYEHGVPLVLRSSPLTITPSSICLQVHKSAVFDLAISPDGKTFASASKDHHIRTWDAQSGQGRKVFEGHASYVYAVAYSPDGLNLVAGSWDSRIIIWCLDGHSEKKVLAGHTDRVLAVAFSPDGTLIVSGSWDKSVRMWEAATGRSLGLGLPTVALSWSPRSHLMAVMWRQHRRTTLFDSGTRKQKHLSSDKSLGIMITSTG